MPDGRDDPTKRGDSSEAAEAVFLNLPSAEDMSSGRIKVVSYIERKSGGLVLLWSDSEEDADPSPEMIERLNHKSVAIFKLYKVIGEDGEECLS
jgi:hypothetical protein